jgi:hypothetical protein
MALRDELATLLNQHSAENGSNTPDFVLAEYLSSCLAAFDEAVRLRDDWMGIEARVRGTLATTGNAFEAFGATSVRSSSGE